MPDWPSSSKPELKYPIKYVFRWWEEEGGRGEESWRRQVQSVFVHCIHKWGRKSTWQTLHHLDRWILWSQSVRWYYLSSLFLSPKPLKISFSFSNAAGLGSPDLFLGLYYSPIPIVCSKKGQNQHRCWGRHLVPPSVEPCVWMTVMWLESRPIGGRLCATSVCSQYSRLIWLFTWQDLVCLERLSILLS